MKRKIWTAVLLAGIMTVQQVSYAAYGSEFSDGAEELQEAEANDFTADAQAACPEVLFSSGEDTEGEGQAPKDKVSIDRVHYAYHPETDSYWAEFIEYINGGSVALQREITGKKVTEIGSRIFDAYRYEPEFKYPVGDIVIPDTVEKIQEAAFENGNMISMTIPDTVKQIGTKAFKSCAKLKYLYFSGGIPVFPQQMFEKCGELDTIEIGVGVITIENGAMKGCPSLEKVYIPASVNQIGEDLFEEGTSVSIYGEKDSYAEQYAAAHGIPFFVRTEEDPQPGQSQVDYQGVRYTYQETSGSYCITDYLGTIGEELVIPETINGKPVSEIGKNAFLSCHKLKKVTIPKSVKKIGDQAFASCVWLEEAVMEPGVEMLGNNVFTGCEGLENVSLPDTVTSMGEKTFAGCSSLKNVKLSAGLTEIPAGTFAIAYFHGTLVVPEGIKTIGQEAFMNGAGDAIQLPSTLTRIEKDAFSLLDVDSITIPGSVTQIGEGIFSGCSIKTITLGWGIKTIPKGAFESCNNLEAIIIPGSVTKIMDGAFRYTKIQRIYIPSSVKYIVKDAFLDSPYLTLYVPKGSIGEKYAKTMKVPFDNGSIYNAVVTKDGIKYQYHTNTQTYKVIKGNAGLSGDIVVPEKINGKKVVSIEQNAFERCENILSVKLPDSITEIGKNAFYGCGLKEIRLPNKLTAIREDTFGLSGLEEISIPSSVKSIESNAFAYSALRKVSVPNTVTDLGAGVFSHCESLEDIILPENMVSVPESFLYGCINLKSIQLPSGLKEIGSRACGYTAITSVEFPPSLKKIGGGAFWGCENLVLDRIPDTVTELGYGIFSFCSGIKELTIPGSIKTLPGDTVYFCENIEKLWIQEGTEIIENASGGIFGGCEKLKEIHISDSVRLIKGKLMLKNDCTIYSTTGSKVEAYCIENGILFQSEGASVLEMPEPRAVVKNGNNIVLAQAAWSKNADFFDYVLTKDKNFPKTGRYLERKDKWEDTEYTFSFLEKGNYYLFLRSGRMAGETGEETEYTDWVGVKASVSVSPSPSKVQKVSVQGNAVTVTVSASPGAQGYGIVLSLGRSKVGGIKYLQPECIQYASKNNRATTYVFKNVKAGSYCVLACAYQKTGNGQTAYSQWSGYNKKIRVKK